MPLSICYTSGTTGRPKGVVYSHRSTVLHTLAVNQPDALALSCRDCILPLAPMFHVNAWGTPFIAAMAGAKVVLAGARVSPEEILDLMAGEGVTHALGVPTIWAGVLDALERQPDRWSLRPGIRFEVGGSAAPADMFRRCDRLGIVLKHGWGMTECSPIAAQVPVSTRYDNLSDDERLSVRASNGIAQPLVEMRIVDENGADLRRDGLQRGELQVRGPFITDRYIGHPEDIPACTDDGWLKTGDVATINVAGYIKIVDRLKDLVKSGGEWISSIEMEGAIMSHPDILEAAVIGVPDAKWSERPLAVIVFKAGRMREPEEIKAFLASHFPRWMVPEQYVVLDEIPKTGAGKFDKRTLRERYGS
jgi:fatty-acyl-CoA synthase